jgi:hypothetical protein
MRLGVKASSARRRWNTAYAAQASPHSGVFPVFSTLSKIELSVNSFPEVLIGEAAR